MSFGVVVVVAVPVGVSVGVLVAVGIGVTVLVAVGVAVLVGSGVLVGTGLEVAVEGICSNGKLAAITAVAGDSAVGAATVLAAESRSQAVKKVRRAAAIVKTSMAAREWDAAFIFETEVARPEDEGP